MDKKFVYQVGNNKKVVSTASGICHTVTATCRYRGRVGTGLSVLYSSVPVQEFIYIYK